MAKLIFNGNEIEVPDSDADWFVKEKGAKRVEAAKPKPKPRSEKA